MNRGKHKNNIKGTNVLKTQYKYNTNAILRSTNAIQMLPRTTPFWCSPARHRPPARHPPTQAVRRMD